MIQGAPPIPDQEFFTMGEACRIAQVPPHTLRYWESEVGFPRPARRTSGHRRYTRTDLETIFEVKRLLQDRRMTMSGARRALLERRRPSSARAEAAAGEAGPASPAALKLLREARQELKELVSELSK
ncbi:MAG: MerR family transcriptional regulator [Elusimicrobiota bacterium]